MTIANASDRKKGGSKKDKRNKDACGVGADDEIDKVMILMMMTNQ